MPIFTKDERSVLFVHVPKTGGTSIERMLIKAGWDVGLRATPKTHPAQMPFLRVSPQHYHAEILRNTLRLGRFDATFLICREPLARFRSEYAMRNKARSDAGSAEHVEAWTRTVMRRAQRNPYVFDNHVRPQHQFVVPKARIFRLEEGMDSIVESLNAEWGLGLTAEAHRHMGSGVEGGISSGDVELNAYVEGEVRQFYARDYALLGYT